MLSSVWLVYRIRVFTLDSTAIFAFERLAGIANPSFHIGFYSDFFFQAFGRVFTLDFIMIFAVKRLSGTANSRFHLGFYSDIRFRALSWYIDFAFSPWIL